MRYVRYVGMGLLALAVIYYAGERLGLWSWPASGPPFFSPF
jgi:hypothetical protein